MSADGNWKIVLSTPMGPQEMQLSIAAQGESFTGKVTSDMGDEDIAGAVDGNRLTWDLKVTRPMPITLSFDIVADGDAMAGNAKLGMFGNAAVTGERI